MGQLSLCPQVLLLPFGVPPMLAPAFMLHTKTFSKFEGCSPPLMWGMQHRARGFWITKCYPSVVCSMSRHFAIWFCYASFVQFTNSFSIGDR